MCLEYHSLIRSLFYTVAASETELLSQLFPNFKNIIPHVIGIISKLKAEENLASSVNTCRLAVLILGDGGV